MIEAMTRTGNESLVPECMKLVWVNERCVMQFESMFSSYQVD